MEHGWSDLWCFLLQLGSHGLYDNNWTQAQALPEEIKQSPESHDREVSGVEIEEESDPHGSKGMLSGPTIVIKLIW